MQKVIYINAFGESVAFASGPPLLLRSVSGMARPEGQIVSTQGAYQSGATVSRVQLPMRCVEVRFELLPQESRAAFYTQRMRMEHVLSVSRAMRNGKTGMLVYENDAGCWQTDAIPEGIAYGKRVGHAAADNIVRFICPNPYLFDGEVQGAALRMSGAGFELATALPVRLGSRSFSAGLVNRGTADAPVTIRIFGTGETPEIVNHTTGARIAVSRKIATGERLVIHTDSAALSCVIEHADGSEEDAFGYLSPTSAVSAFVLSPGTNEVEYVPSAASTNSRVEIEWRSCYEGV